ncbi:unnamed protein product, partial [Scytosiphon promiscuus]
MPSSQSRRHFGVVHGGKYARSFGSGLILLGKLRLYSRELRPDLPAPQVATTSTPVASSPEPTTAPTPSTRGGISSSVASPAPSAFTAPDTMSPTSTTPLADADPTPQPSASATSFTTGPVEGVIPVTGDDDAGAATPSPAEEVGPTPDPEATSCEEDESFQITSSALPVTQGCFQIATETFSTPGTTIEVWSVDGTVDPEQVLVGGLAED